MSDDEGTRGPPQRVLDQVKQGEGQETEFKQDFPPSVRDLAVEIASFASSNEGRIFLGVGDNSAIHGLPREKGEPEAVRNDRIQTRIQGISQSVSPRIRVQVEFFQHDEKVFCEIFVPKGREPIYYVNSIPYIRDLNVSRKAKPEEVKEKHLEYFQASGAARARPNLQGLMNVLDQLSDLDLLLFDVEKRHGSDLKQWRYDLQVTAEALRNLSTESGVSSIGADEEVRQISNAVDRLVSEELFMNGGASWKSFLKSSEELKADAWRLRGRIEKNSTMSAVDLTDISDLTQQNLMLLRDRWGLAEEMLQQGRLSSLRADLRRLSLLFSRYSTRFRVAAESELSDLTQELSIVLRGVDSQDFFGPGLGINPIDQMRGEIHRAIEIGDRIGQALNSWPRSFRKGPM